MKVFSISPKLVSGHLLWRPRRKGAFFLTMIPFNNSEGKQGVIWGFSSVVEYLPSKYKVLDSISSTRQTTEQNKLQKGQTNKRTGRTESLALEVKGWTEKICLCLGHMSGN